MFAAQNVKSGCNGVGHPLWIPVSGLPGRERGISTSRVYRAALKAGCGPGPKGPSGVC